MYEESKKYTMYRDRKEWDDITPLSQDDGPHPVVKIMYCEKCEYYTLNYLDIEFIDSSGLNHIMFAHNSVALT